MSAAESETLPRSNSAPVRTLNARPTLSLGNQDSNMETNFQPTRILTPPTKNTNKIPTYIIWSIFNLLFIPFGIFCCYFSYKVNLFKRQNHHETAEEWSNRTLILNIVTTILMICFIITVAMLEYDHIHRNMVLQGNQTQATAIYYFTWQPGR
jgi:heme/copper-type cytochrome/quinol oxidase subunit 2